MKCVINFFVSYIIACTLLISQFEPIETMAAPSLNKGEIYFAFFELPDGEATLIRTDKEKNMLINTGSQKSEESLLFQLKELGVQTIDKLLLTKQTIDYCGNANRVIHRYNIEEVYHAGKLSNICKKQVSKSKTTQWKADQSFSFARNLQINVLQAKENGDMSLGIIYGKNSILFLSQGKVDNEEQLLKIPVKPNIIKIGNYAKGNSPSSSILSKLDPHLSIVFHCDNCVPNEGLIERLNESWIDVYQLKYVGTTVIRMDLNDYEILS
ncbi:hypothetical protein [Aquibacillus albus]|uniref:Beta-lactamase superfamily II metal-dependent hydrolase n=1 Tax=Aquibacillus albus TaxID=1168171 RepID=A0ABS2MVC8_9BACI|nr:hypothetical protein [Aquibacillus albus]MBM7569854.1 beta-lactamase superfamily II metal-dependent hydrolase [Aquibacillus albus]